MTSYESWGTYELPGGGGGTGSGVYLGRWTGQEIDAGETVSLRGGMFQASVNIPAPSPEPFTLAGVLDSNYVALSMGPVLVDTIPNSGIDANYPPSLRLSTDLVQWQLLESGGVFVYEEGVTSGGGGGTPVVPSIDQGLVERGDTKVIDDFQVSFPTSSSRQMFISYIGAGTKDIAGTNVSILSSGTTHRVSVISTLGATQQECAGAVFSFNGEGQSEVYTFYDKSNGSCYVATLIIGFGYSNNYLSIERK